MDSNCHLGQEIIEGDVNEQNFNGKLFMQFLERMPNLTLVNCLELCEGTITRMRKTIKGVELSVLDVFVTCDRLLPYITKMTVDEKREHVLTNFKSVKTAGKVIESDHCPISLDINLTFSKVKPERIEFFQFKNKEAQIEFKKLTTNTTKFSDCFTNELPFEKQALNWRKLLNRFFHQTFKKIRISNKPRKMKNKIGELMEKRQKLKKEQVKTEDEDNEIIDLEGQIADACQEDNRKKILDNFSEMDGNNGNLDHQGVWKTKKKYFSKIKPSLPVGKKNWKNQMITNPEELKELYLETFKFRLRKRPVKPGFE